LAVAGLGTSEAPEELGEKMSRSLSRRPVRSVLRAIGDATTRWSAADFPPRLRALRTVGDRTGYTDPVVEYAFDRLFGALTSDALEATVAAELGSLDVLDHFVPCADSVRIRAVGLGRVCVISSRTTIGVAIVPAIFALIAKCDVLVKDREDALVAAFFGTLAEELEEFADAAVAQAWQGEKNERDLAGFDAVAAFGDDDALARIRASLPLRTHFIPYGTRASVGYVGREALSDRTAALAVAQAAARDLVLYESEGCLSLHALFVEDGAHVTPNHFAQMLAREVERAAIEFPLPVRAPQTLARLGAARDLAVFHAAVGGGSVYSDAAATFVVELDPPAEQPPAFLPRAIPLRTVDSPQAATAYLQRHGVAVEAVAIAKTRPDLIALAAHLGAARIARFGQLQAPRAQTRHGGRPRIAEFIRWMTDEAGDA
jgi:Acyl-CoA reductase (LuxC)